MPKHYPYDDPKAAKCIQLFESEEKKNKKPTYAALARELSEIFGQNINTVTVRRLILKRKKNGQALLTAAVENDVVSCFRALFIHFKFIFSFILL